MKIKMTARLFTVFVLIGVIIFTQQRLQFAQQITDKPIKFVSSQGEEVPENVIFERLFESINYFSTEADKQEKSGFPQRAKALRTYYQRKASLNIEQVQKLKELAEDFQKEVNTLKEQKIKIESSLNRQSDENGSLTELYKIYEKRGGLWSKYRDLLHNNFGDEKFEEIRRSLQENIAGKIKRTIAYPKRHPDFTAKEISNNSQVFTFYNYSYTDLDYDEESETLLGNSVTWIEGGRRTLFCRF